MDSQFSRLGTLGGARSFSVGRVRFLLLSGSRRRAAGVVELFCFSRKWRNTTSELYYDSEGVSPMRKARKNYTPPEKVAILRRHLIDRVPVSDLCDEYQLPPSLFYAWQKLFFENGAVAFERKNGSAEQSHLRTIAALRDKLQRKNEVVAELMEEHIQLKKELGEL
jgi:transposase